MSQPRVLVLGAGGWGTALAMVLERNGARVRLWGHDAAYADEIATTRRNPKFLPGVTLPAAIDVSGALTRSDGPWDIILSIVPTQFLRSALASLEIDDRQATLVVSGSKGIERGSLELPSEILRTRFPRACLVALSGPSHAEEVARGLPASLVAASRQVDDARRAADALNSSAFRVYTSQDMIGVELGGAVKNIIAIAAGIADGLGLGDNTRAALITRGAHELARLGKALGARRETFSGLAGIGDLIATCTSPHSRNRAVGLRIGGGETLEVILRSSEKVPEGVDTTRSLVDLAGQRGLDLPITEQVHAILFQAKAPREAVQSLMSRATKDEFEGA